MRHVLQVEAIAGVVFRIQQQPAGPRRSPLQRQACSPPAAASLRPRGCSSRRIQVGVHGRAPALRMSTEFTVEDRGVLRPLQAEPALDRRRRVQNVPTAQRGAVQRRGNGDDNLAVQEQAAARRVLRTGRGNAALRSAVVAVLFQHFDLVAVRVQDEEEARQQFVAALEFLDRQRLVTCGDQLGVPRRTSSTTTATWP